MPKSTSHAFFSAQTLFEGGAFSNTNDSNKIRLNLSAYALHRLEEDTARFRVKFGALVNQVFLNFYAQADASVAHALTRTWQQWEGLLASDAPELRSISHASREQLLRALLAQTAASLCEKALGYPAEEARQVYLWEETYRYLTTPGGDCREAPFYRSRAAAPAKQSAQDGSNHMAWYVKAVLEEYARLPALAREKIYCKNALALVQQAAESGHQLAVRTADGRVYHIAPIGTQADAQNGSLYLVGLDVPIAQLSAKGCTRCVSYLLCELKQEDLQILRSRTAKLTQAQHSRFATALAQRGAAALGSGADAEIITVRLSEAGLRLYRATPFLRPQGTYHPDTRTLALLSTEQAVLRYFLQFGSEAEVLSPPSVRFAFAQEYHRALALYT